MVDCSFEVVPFPEEYNLSKQVITRLSLGEEGSSTRSRDRFYLSPSLTDRIDRTSSQLASK